MTDFIRDPRTGGCAAGVPPANLGFRLVVEDEQLPALHRMVEKVGLKLRSALTTPAAPYSARSRNRGFSVRPS